MRVALLANIKPDGMDLWNRNAGGGSDDKFAEWDTLATIEAVRSALASHPDIDCEIVEAIPEVAIPRLMVRKYDIVFNLAEGSRGADREAQFPAVLEMLGIPYTGSAPWTLATTLDKVRTKETLAYHNVPVGRFASTTDRSATLEKLLPGCGYPVVVKPTSEGSSKGVTNSSFVKDDTELRAEISRIVNEYGQQAIVEEFLSGREFTVAVIGNGSEARVLPIVEIKFNALPAEANALYSYEAKWVYDTAEHPLDLFSCPADLPAELEREITDVVLRAYHVLGCRDWSRIDIRLNVNGNANVIEVNPLPGILPNPEDNSCFPKAARTAGMGYNEMMLAVLAAGCKRYGIRL
ncbi:MAG TPA: ATP-grasp domain-containing protein [Candidatus Kapabacteria bacterium]|nr:ATP-grasp domain-containing protein [Candidatus Kapabacteria bacterium]